MPTKKTRTPDRPRRPSARANNVADMKSRRKRANGKPPRSSRVPASPESSPGVRTPEVVASLLSPGNFSRIARGAGYRQQHVSRLLRGLSGCSFDAAIKIAQVAGVTMDELRDYIVTQRAADIKAKAASA